VNNLALKRIPRAGAGKPTDTVIVVGTLESVSDAGDCCVDYPGNERGPLRARVLIGAGAPSRPNWLPGESVVLLLGNTPAEQPVILGIAANRVPPSIMPIGVNSHERDARVDGRRVVLEAQAEIVLRCGKSSITLTADGKIVIKGAELVSRSSGVNKIKGAQVNIN